jgi:hypothetical protein
MLRVTCFDVVQRTPVLFIDFRKKWSRLLQGRFTTSVGNYGCRSAMRLRTQHRTDKHVSCLYLQMKQTSYDDFNCVSLLGIVKCINPCIVLKYDIAGRYGTFGVSFMQTGERVGRDWIFPVMAIMRSKLECFHFRVLYLPPSCTPLSTITLSPLSNCHYSGGWESENANLMTVFIKIWTSAL